MKKLICCVAFVGTILPSLADAQVMIDMSRVTCADYLAMPPGQSHVFSAWMSGWFNQKYGRVAVDLMAFDKNAENIRQRCASDPKEAVMTMLQRVIPPRIERQLVMENSSEH